MRAIILVAMLSTATIGVTLAPAAEAASCESWDIRDGLVNLCANTMPDEVRSAVDDVFDPALYLMCVVMHGRPNCE